MPEYKRLAIHNSACNDLYFKFQECEAAHPFRQIFGFCWEFQKAFRDCIKDQGYTANGKFTRSGRETRKIQGLSCVGRKRATIMIDSTSAVEAGSRNLDLLVDELEFPPEEDIFDMVKDVNLNDPLPTVTERYFTAYYRINFPKEGDDICIRMHSNRLCMISLAPSHAIYQEDRKIEKVDFQVTDKLNRADNTVSGKAKHGAQPMHESSKICSITCTDGNTWMVRCGMNGKLTEANTDLLENPRLVMEPPHKGGYLAIVLPKINAIDKLKQSLMTQEVYDAAIRDRLNSKISNTSSKANGAVKRPCDDDKEPIQCREKIIKIEAQECERNVANDKIETSTLPCT